LIRTKIPAFAGMTVLGICDEIERHTITRHSVKHFRLIPLGTPISALAHKRVTTNTVTQVRCGNTPCDLHTTSQTTKAPANRSLAFPGWRILCFGSEYFGAKSIQISSNSLCPFVLIRGSVHTNELTGASGRSGGFIKMAPCAEHIAHCDHTVL
jgi:hypothetical protein